MVDFSELSDEQIVLLVRNKDPELYGQLIRRYQTKLTHYLRKFIADHDELEDVLQEVFIKAYRNLFDFKVERKFSSWIYRIAHNEAVNHLKKYKKEVINLDAEELEIVDKNMELTEIVDRVILKDKLTDLLLTLEQKYRDPLVLYFFEQKTYEEISDILQIPINTVGTLISRGKQLLKKLI